MAVVINEFEVVPEAPSAISQARARPETEARTAPTGTDLEQKLRQQIERDRRVRAH